MKHLLWVLLLCPAATAVACPTGQAKDEAAIAETEKTWARALDAHNTDTLACILADEFEVGAALDSPAKTSDLLDLATGKFP